MTCLIPGLNEKLLAQKDNILAQDGLSHLIVGMNRMPMASIKCQGLLTNTLLGWREIEINFYF